MNNKIFKKKHEIPNFLAEFAFFLQALYYYVNASYYSKYFNMGALSRGSFILTVTVLLYLFVSQRKISLDKLLIIFFTAIIVVAVGMNSDDFRNLILLFLFMINGDRLNENNFLRFCTYCNIIFLLVVVVSSQIGIIPNEMHYDVNYGARQFLGFTFYIAPNIMLFITLMYIAYRKDLIRVWEIVALVVSNMYFYYMCNVRSSFWTAIIVLLVVLIMSLYHRYVNSTICLNKFWKCISYAFFPICLIITYGMPILYMRGVGFAQTINELTTRRIALEAQAYQVYGVKLFGQIMNFNTWTSNNFRSNLDYFYIDSAFIRYMFTYGAVLMIIVFIGYFKYIDSLIKRNDIYYLIAVFGTIVHFITGSQMFYIIYNPFIIFLLSFIYQKRKQYETKV